MFLMKTNTVTIPMYGNEAIIKEKRVSEPQARGRFRRETIRVKEKDLALFYPDLVEGVKRNGYTNLFPSCYILSVADLMNNGHSDLFENQDSAKIS